MACCSSTCGGQIFRSTAASSFHFSCVQPTHPASLRAQRHPTGNGGSAAISNHYVVDFLKFFREKTNYNPKIVSLSNNIETITAISNDIDYKYIFSYQAENLCNKNDLIIIISSSGNSKNIIELVKFAKKRKITTIGFSGFKGGYLKKNSDISVHVNINNYGITEDIFQIYMHIIMQFLRQKNTKLNKLSKLKF